MSRHRDRGWRFASIDFRFQTSDAQLVEYYATFDDVMKANDHPCHALYERGRGLTADDPDLQDLIESCKDEYDRAWSDAP